MKMLELILTKDIIQDEKVQQRAGGINQTRVREYARAMSDGDEFPPVIIFFDSQKYWLADGFHRCAASELLFHSDIKADIRKGERRDAILFAAGANADHGVRRTNGDKRRAVKTLLEDKEWNQWSDHEIARMTKVTQPFVSKVRKEIFDKNDKKKDIRKTASGEFMNVKNIGSRSYNSSSNSKTINHQSDLRYVWSKSSKNEKIQLVENKKEEILKIINGLR